MAAIKQRQSRSGWKKWQARLSSPFAKTVIAVLVVVAAVFLGIFAYYYIKYEKIIDARMRGRIFNNASKIYATPRVVREGDPYSQQELISYLRRAGYVEAGEGESKLGSYKRVRSGLEVQPGPESFHSAEGATLRFAEGKVERIVATGNQQDLAAYELEPQLVTALFEGEQRSKRRLVSFTDLPQHTVDAVLAIEDRRFFEHSGINYFRLAQAAWIDFRTGEKGQGASTITMQIARGFFLTPEKTIRRKLTEMLIAFELEQRFSKQQIFELYANSVYMGQRGSFTINGFGEAAQAYFGKDIKNLTVPESALIAAIIQRPSYLNPYKNAERALERRNLVLDGMVETGALTPEEAEKAKATPLKLASPNVEASDAPYFVDLVKEQLVQKYQERELNEQSYRIYTTLDPELQRAAAEAVQAGIKSVDEQAKKLRTRRVKVGTGKSAKTEEKVLPGPMPQVALIAMDPHTGEVLALVGGRNYGWSQLNHAVAKRPTGSIFKPFVYAAAVNTAVAGAEEGKPVLTPATLVDDSPGTFAYGDQIYEPRNYKEEYHGMVTARYALAMSLNNATVRVAEMAGYDRVAALARDAGIKSAQGTPAVALGSYDATPLDMAGAYTVFANNGVRVSPLLVSSVRNAKGDPIEDFKAEKRPVLDPRVAYVLTNMMEAVINSGTAAGVRGMGFSAPAAGKTGTSHDAWFAGYTSNLLCIVWVGYDDYSDLRLSGAMTAAPIWAAFMKKAVALPQYRNVRGFAAPSGVVTAQIDKVTGRLATPTCPDDFYAAFIAGTEPHDTCDHIADDRNVFQKIFGIGNPGPQAPQPVSNGQQAATGQQPAAGEDPNKKKKGFFGKLFGVFGGGDKKPAATSPASTPTATPSPSSSAPR
ncbi:MAG TPA: PBP1A family penicillin-binding protein [Terriglobales bacterium]|nr:PBP1A family penicillin-binding protein [Terriglobales bacterium]